MLHLRRALALLAGLVVAVVALAVAPAGAHDDEGQITVTVAEQADAARVVLEVGIVYTNDGHPAESATVSATLTGPDGQVVGPVDLAREEGTSLYRAEIDVPATGSWSAAITSSEPAATAEATIEVAEVATTTSSPATTAPDGPPATVDGDGGDGDRQAQTTSAAAEDDDGGDNGTAIIVAVVVGILVIAAVAGWVLYRRANAQGGDTST